MSTHTHKLTMTQNARRNIEERAAAMHMAPDTLIANAINLYCTVRPLAADGTVYVKERIGARLHVKRVQVP